ncbi:Lrp/AsnC family transcriptional regulator [Salaquimonas pukyongi]|uniref:Lrp/AsnC family transcriptional regulator n=1 Tax=Salaquimonas pukyongi TaxID=2712698 RepID=UPI00096B6DFE|nr:Lrp/AsnC family transcriptional regulator [Salaquimonas pukyongi]
MPFERFDKIDRAILSALQDNARISNVDLAERVGLSQSACLRRVQLLEKEGVIEGYHAVISNRAIGQTITAIIQITLNGQSEEHLRKFEDAVSKCPFIVACFLMSGQSDYVIRVNARDMEHFEQIHKNWLSTLPGVSRMLSSFAMRMVVNRANVDVSSL